VQLRLEAERQAGEKEERVHTWAAWAFSGSHACRYRSTSACHHASALAGSHACTDRHALPDLTGSEVPLELHERVVRGGHVEESRVGVVLYRARNGVSDHLDDFLADGLRVLDGQLHLDAAVAVLGPDAGCAGAVSSALVLTAGGLVVRVGGVSALQPLGQLEEAGNGGRQQPVVCLTVLVAVPSGELHLHVGYAEREGKLDAVVLH